MSSFNYEKALSLEWNGQVFVLTVRKETNVGTDYLYSYDGSIWTSSLDISNSSILTTKSAYNTKWTGSNYAIIGNLSTSSGNTLLRSADGIKFSSIPSNPGIPLYDLEVNLEYPHTITFPRNTTLALGGASGDSTKIAYSIDEGITWTPSINSSTAFNTTVNNALWNGKVWVAVGATTNTIATSVDGNTWIGRGSYIFTTSGYAIAWSNEQVQWVAGGSGTNSIAYSPDGVYWSGIGNTILSTVYDIKWNGSIWVAAGVPISGNKSLAYSYDGKSWSLPTQTNLFDIKASKIGWNGSFWIAVGNSTSADGSYNIATSANGIVWNMQWNQNMASSTIQNMYSNPLSPITLYSFNGNYPNAPTGLSVSSVTSTTITITFSSPSASTQPVVSYRVIATPSSGSVVTQTFNAPATSYTITGLVSAVLYSVVLYAVNIYGNSPVSSTVSATTITFPSAPSGLTAGTATPKTIPITWTSPNDATITTYTVTAVPSSGTTVTQTFNAPATSYTITGLTSNTSYTISLAATNSVGTGSSSSVSKTTAVLQLTTNVSSGSGSVTTSTYTSGSTYIYYSFNTTSTNSTTFTFTINESTSINYLVVAGGGAGGYGLGSGGGAGGVLSGNVNISSGITYTITTGGGGAAQATPQTAPVNGKNSVFSGSNITTITALGGGGGMSQQYGVNVQGTAAASGGSGAGADRWTTKGLGTAGQGNNGGNNYISEGTPGRYCTGGGGGAGGVGGNATPTSAGVGGVGISNSITGTAVFYGGGGGGACQLYSVTGSAANGGNGGGGRGSLYQNSAIAVAATSGTNGTGGGGGGTENLSGTSQTVGGSGIVIISFIL